MSDRNNRCRILAMLCLAAGVLCAPNVVSAQMPCGYEVTAIIQAPKCPPHGYPATLGLGISEPIDGGLPNVVGYYLNCAVGPNTAFVWIGNENKFTTLDFPFGTSQSQANDISADGTLIVGTADVVGEGTRGFLFDGKELTIIPTAGGSYSHAAAINSQRQIVGTTPDPKSGFNRAYIWEDEVMTLIEPTFGPRSVGLNINDSGAVVGWMGTSNTVDSHALFWAKGLLTDLGVIPGGFSGWASAINGSGEIVISGLLERDRVVMAGAFLWQKGRLIDLGLLPGFNRCTAVDLNDSTTVIGNCDQSRDPNNDRPFVWSKGLMTDLNDLILPEFGLTVRIVEALNQAGQITGRGADDSGNVVSFVLTPIAPLFGDLNGDCAVSTIDLLMLLSTWGLCRDCDDCSADFDGNCVVGTSDLLILLANWS